MDVNELEDFIIKLMQLMQTLRMGEEITIRKDTNNIIVDYKTPVENISLNTFESNDFSIVDMDEVENGQN